MQGIRLLAMSRREPHGYLIMVFVMEDHYCMSLLELKVCLVIFKSATSVGVA
jgi:hypothetical protein